MLIPPNPTPPLPPPFSLQWWLAGRITFLYYASLKKSTKQNVPRLLAMRGFKFDWNLSVTSWISFSSFTEGLAKFCNFWRFRQSFSQVLKTSHGTPGFLQWLFNFYSAVTDEFNVVMPSNAKHISLLLFHILIYKRSSYSWVWFRNIRRYVWMRPRKTGLSTRSPGLFGINLPGKVNKKASGFTW